MHQCENVLSINYFNDMVPYRYENVLSVNFPKDEPIWKYLKH